MKLKGPLIPAVFIDRPNRFTTNININNNIFLSHLADPGRLEELLVPGAKLFVLPAPINEKRITKYSTVLVQHKDKLISLVSTFPNQFVKDAILNNQLPMLKSFTYVRSEVSIKNHRIDFLLRTKKRENFYLEVKSVTFVDKNIAKFPDAITARGKKHVDLLRKLRKEGHHAGILFVCQRSDADIFEPMVQRDPAFTSSLLKAFKEGVNIWCITLNVNKTEITFNKEIPVNLPYK